MIFIHCPALNHIYWRPVMERLAPVCRCIAIDVRGHGRSGLGDTPWTFADIGDDLAMLTRNLGLDHPVLVGYSAGGTIALRAAVDHPGLFGGVVPVSTFSQCCNVWVRAKVAVGALAVRLGLTPFIGPNIITTNSADAAHMRAMLPLARQVPRESMLSFFEETLRTDFTADLPRIQVPVLIVGGAKDDLMHRYVAIMRQKLPVSRAVFFPETDHRVPTREPERFADLVAEFLAELEPADPAEDPGELVLPTYLHPGSDQPQLHT